MRFRLRLLLASLVAASAADAQEPSAESSPVAPAPEAAPPEATPAEATPAEPAAEPEDARYVTAKRYFQQGVAFFEAGNYNAALAEFENAYEHLRGHPKRYFVLDNIGQCYERLFRYDLALAYYRRYLEEGGPGAEDRETVAATIRALEGLLGKLEIRSNVRAEVWIDERQMGEAPGTVLVPAGRHTLELRARGHEPAKQEISVTARDTAQYSFELEAIEEYEGLHPAYFWTGAALTGAALAGGTYFGIKALNRHDEVEARAAECNSAFCVIEDERRDVTKLAITADIFFASAAVFGVGTGLLYFMTDWDGSGKEQPESTAPRAAAIANREFVGVNVWGAF